MSDKDEVKNNPYIIQVDNKNNSSFLNLKKFEQVQSYINMCRTEIAKNSKKRDILKKVQQFLTFEKCFKTRGVQGIAGILNIRTTKQKVVFKVSVDLDNTVEHENIISEELNKLRTYCPHFVGNLGIINLPISNDFIDKPDDYSLFNNSNSYFLCNVLLMEYVSPITFHYICKYLHDEKNIVLSQIIQVCMALDISQTKCKLTHYDLHMDNILIRRIDPNSMFLYVTKGKKILVPTFGYYPVIIDLGNSYVKAVEGKPMYTRTDNYQYGLQSTLYDPINDLHHFLLSSFNYLDDKGYAYDWLNVRFMYYFRHIPLWCQKGWKILPYDIFELVLKRIKNDCPSLKSKFKVWKEYRNEIICILNGLIILPWLDNDNLSFENCLENFLIELEKLYNMKMTGNESDIVYVLRETVLIINQYRDEYIKDPIKTLEILIPEWKKRISFIISHNLKEIPKNLDFKKLVDNALLVSEKMSTNYYEYIKEHVTICNDSYLKTKIHGPIDAVNLILQNGSIKYSFNKDTLIYVWDSDKEKQTILDCSKLTDTQLDMLDNEKIIKKGDLLFSFLFN